MNKSSAFSFTRITVKSIVYRCCVRTMATASGCDYSWSSVLLKGSGDNLSQRSLIRNITEQTATINHKATTNSQRILQDFLVWANPKTAKTGETRSLYWLGGIEINSKRLQHGSASMRMWWSPPVRSSPIRSNEAKQADSGCSYIFYSPVRRCCSCEVLIFDNPVTVWLVSFLQKEPRWRRDVVCSAWMRS